MAKKIRKSQKVRMSPRRLFVVLVTPWIILGVVAVVLFEAGLPDYAAIVIALASSLLVTYIIRVHDVRKAKA